MFRRSLYGRQSGVRGQLPAGCAPVSRTPRCARFVWQHGVLWRHGCIRLVVLACIVVSRALRCDETGTLDHPWLHALELRRGF